MRDFNVLIIKKGQVLYTRVVYQTIHSQMYHQAGSFHVGNCDCTELQDNAIYLRGHSDPHRIHKKNIYWIEEETLKTNINNFNKRYKDNYELSN